ncbi:lipase 1-like isoform X2 [Choristoneura fumiferana]
MRLNCIVTLSVFVCVGALNIKEIKYVRKMDEKVMLEMHQVTTSDLYILTVFRLRNLKMNITRNQHPVLMFHGLMESSDRFIEHGRNLSLAYDLVDAGFDVWLGNNRGNKYSRRHVYLNPDDPEDKFSFFNYTYEDIGVNDVSAIVDYILNETKTKQLHYIGHSQGGTIFFVLNSLRPKYNEKFLTANLLAGAGYQKYFSNSLIEILASLADKIYEILLKAGYVELFPSKSVFQLSSTNTIEDLVKRCLSSTRLQSVCEMLHSNKMLGAHGINSTGFAGGGAVKQFIHFSQNVRQKQFCRWDYEKQNKQVYGTDYPPNYDLGLITANTTLHFGMGDNLVNYKDVADMANDMPNARTRKVARDDFGHSDFTDSFDAKELVYDYIIEALLNFER